MQHVLQFNKLLFLNYCSVAIFIFIGDEEIFSLEDSFSVYIVQDESTNDDFKFKVLRKFLSIHLRYCLIIRLKFFNEID
jgi:hypothetical protein